MTFKELLKEIKKQGIKCRSNQDWELFLEKGTPTEFVQKIITICRNNALTSWHIKFPVDGDGNVVEDDIRMYWDLKTQSGN